MREPEMKPNMIYESTYDDRMRRTMDELEEMLQSGRSTITLDIREFQHIIATMVSLNRDRLRMENVLFGKYQSMRQSFNLNPAVPQIIKDPKEP